MKWARSHQNSKQVTVLGGDEVIDGGDVTDGNVRHSLKHINYPKPSKSLEIPKITPNTSYQVRYSH